jgi:exopolyphosphatase / guanosine-5'-triphosphate,3'-diphosphate pyrophosphatase
MAGVGSGSEGSRAASPLDQTSSVESGSAATTGDVLAAVDIGTNSFHLVVARVRGPHAFEVLAREKEMVRLGSGAGDMKHLAEGAVERGVAALRRFRQVAEVHGADGLLAVATSAVREAENRADFVERARAEAGVDVEVVSGVEEARLIHLGVLQALEVFDQRLLLCDIGGGSTELLVGHRGEPLMARSLKLGAIRLTERFFDAKRVKRSAVEACRQHVSGSLTAYGRAARATGFEVAVGSSGTIEALCAMAVARSTDAAPRTLNGYVLTRQALDGVVDALLDAPTVAKRTELPGLDARRADIILAGAIICEQVFEVCGLDRLTFSDYALREGVLLAAWQHRNGGSLHQLSDLRRRSVLHLQGVMDEDPGHSAHVAELALQLFDGTTGHHRLGGDAREYLEAGALLCNVGLFVAHASHHRHSYYVIRNSEHLAGFTDREIELVALIARYHRKSAPKPKHPEFAALDADDRRLVRWCSALLRVAIALDRTYDARVRAVRVVPPVDGEALRVEVVPRDGADPSLELHWADQRKALLEDVVDGEVVVAEAGS